MTSQAMLWTVESSRPRQSAFVLIELVAVLFIIALLAAVTAVSLRVPLQNARLERALTALEDADRRARRESIRSSGTIELLLDDRRTIQRTNAVGERKESKRALPVNGDLHIDRYLVTGPSDGRTNTDQLSIQMVDGQSETYALRLNTNRDAANSRHEWLVVIGATGQYIRAKEDSVVEAILQR